VILVDEVGPFELAGGGWAPAVDDLARGYAGPVLLVVRTSILDAVKRRWGSADTVTWEAGVTSAQEIASTLAHAGPTNAASN
jgi:hypothetical protein